MAMTYTWEVTGLKKRNTVNASGEALSGAVVQTYWKCTGTDASGETAFFSGATPFSADNVAAGSFVPFEQLTEETVLGWIRNVVDNDTTYWEHIQGQIAKQIDQRNIEDAAMPWAPEEPAEPEEMSVTPEPAGEAPAEEESANTAE